MDQGVPIGSQRRRHHRLFAALLMSLTPLCTASGQSWSVHGGVDVGRAAELHAGHWERTRVFAGGALGVEHGGEAGATGFRTRWSSMPVAFTGTKTCTGGTTQCSDPRRRQEVVQFVAYRRRPLIPRLDLVGGVGAGWYRRRYLQASDAVEARAEPERKVGAVAELGIEHAWRSIRLGARLEGGVMPGVKTGVLLDCPAPGPAPSGFGQCREERRTIAFHRMALGATFPLIR